MSHVSGDSIDKALITHSVIRVKFMRRILFAGILIAIGWLFSGIGNLSLDACNHIQDRLGQLQIASGLADGDSETPPLDPLRMIAFEPLGAEIRIVLPDAVRAVVHGRVRLFLSDNANAYLATAGEGSWLGIAGKPESVTIYHAIGLG